MKTELNIPFTKREADIADFRFTPLMAIIIVKGDDFWIHHASHDVPSIWGRNRDDILGKRFFEAFPMLRDSIVEKHFITGLHSTKSHSYKRFRNSHSVGGPHKAKYLDLQIEPLLEDGRVAGLILIAVESPPKSRTSRNQMKVRALFNEGPDRISFKIGKFGIWNWYVKTGKVYWSKDQEILFGLQEGEFSGTFREFLSFVHPEDITRIKDRPGFAHGAEPEHQYEYRIRRKDGQVRWIQTRSRTVFLNSELEYVTGINIDVTEQKEYQKRLEESEKEWKSMANAMPQLVWVADASGKVIYYNRRIEEYAGASKLVDGTWNYQALFHADDVEATTAAWLRSFQEGTFFEQEHRLHMKDGSYRWHLNRAVPYRNKEGEIIKWYGTATDIHDLKATQEKLKENEERFRSLAENSPDIITRHARDHTYLYASPPIEKYLNIAPDAFIGQSYWDLGFPQPVCEFFDKHLKIAFETEELQTVEFEMPGEIFVLSRMVPEYNETGEMVSVLILSTNISERKKAEKKLQYLATLTRSIPDAVVGTDLDHRITSWNSGAEKIYGWKEEEVIGKTGKEVLQTQFPNGDADLWRQALVTTGCWQGEVVQMRKDGSSVPVLVSISDVRDIDGRLIGAVGVNRDISEQKRAEEAFRNTKEQLEQVFNSFPSSIFLFDASGKTIFVNENAAKFSGFELADTMQVSENFSDTRKVALQKSDFFLESGEPMQVQHSPTYQTMKSGQASQVVLKAVDKVSREHAWYTAMSSPLFNDKGELHLILTTVIDITIEKTADEKVRLSEKRFSSLAQATTSMTWVMSPQASFESPQPSWEAYTGQRWPDYQGAAWLEMIQQEDREKVMNAWRDSRALKKMFEIEGRMWSAKHFSYRYFESKAVPIMNSYGQIAEWIGMSTDVHEQKMADQRIRESEQRFRMLAESLPQLIWMTDGDGKSEYFSSQWEEYSGIDFSSEDAWSRLVHPDDLPGIMQIWRESLSNGQTYQGECRLRRKDGEYRWHTVLGEPLRGSHENIIRWIGAFTDINDQKTVAEKLEALVAARTSELLRSNEDLLQFAHVTSHDLKEPVRKIRTFSGLLAQTTGDTLSEKAKTYLSKIESSSTRIYQMIEGVLLYSSVDSVNTLDEQVNLRDLVTNIQSDLELVIQQKQAKIEMSNLSAVRGSSVLLYQLFYNLINNSLKFARNDVPPLIRISSGVQNLKTPGTKPRKVHCIELSDNGIGFEMKYADQIFKTFTRLHSKDKYEGTGLGLSLCKKIIERHGGSITAESVENNGTSFRIILPL